MRLWLLSHLDPNAIQLTLAPWRRWGEPGLLLFLIRYNLIFTHFWHLALTEPVGASSGRATSLTLMVPLDLTVPQAQILRGHFGCAFSTLREADFPVLETSSGLEPSPEITARAVGLALPVERGTAFAVSVRRQCWRLAARQSLQHSVSTKTK